MEGKARQRLKQHRVAVEVEGAVELSVDEEALQNKDALKAKGLELHWIGRAVDVDIARALQNWVAPVRCNVDKFDAVNLRERRHRLSVADDDNRFVPISGAADGRLHVRLQANVNEYYWETR